MIVVEDLVREFFVTVRDPGLCGALRSVVNRKVRTVTAVRDVGFTARGGEVAAAAVGLAVLAWRSELRRYAGAMS